MGSQGAAGERYSQVEREQRWVLRSAPAGTVDPVEVSDL
jgi:hypothetical protein